MTTTTEIAGEVQGADVGLHSTAGTIAQAEAAANARVIETTTVMSEVESAAKAEIAAEQTTGLQDGQGLGAEIVGQTAGNVLEQIDLARSSMKDIASVVENTARSIDDDTSRMSNSGMGGFARQAKTNETTEIGKGAVKTGSAVAGGIAGTKLGVVSASLDGENGMKPRADGGNLKGGNSYNAAQSAGLGRGQAPQAAPRMAPAPAGPGMGGGSAQSRLATARSSVDVNRSRDKMGEIEREKSMRGDTPGGMSRAEFEGQQHRDKIQGGDQAAQSQQMAHAAVKNPFLMEMNMNMAPKPPSNIEGEYMGGNG